MAVLAAFDIADLFPWQSVQVYTVGAPRPGNRAFAAQYQAKVPATWHIINPKVCCLSDTHHVYCVIHNVRKSILQSILIAAVFLPYVRRTTA